MNAFDQENKARLLVVEDHVVVRDGLVALINREKDLEVLWQADNAADATNLILHEKPDLVIADMMLREGNGIDLVKTIKPIQPQTKFLIISMQDEEVYAERCLKAGASGYIMKHSATEEFIDAIRLVLSGEIYISKKMNIRLLRKVANHETIEKTSILEGFTDREIQVFQMLGSGMSPREIAPKLNISPKTVATHRENLKIKLGVKDSRALLQAAIRWVDESE